MIYVHMIYYLATSILYTILCIYYRLTPPPSYRRRVGHIVDHYNRLSIMELAGGGGVNWKIYVTKKAQKSTRLADNNKGL